MGATLDMDIVAEGLETIEQVTRGARRRLHARPGLLHQPRGADYLAAMLLSQARRARRADAAAS
jgi:hypothetical protein